MALLKSKDVIAVLLKLINIIPVLPMFAVHLGLILQALRAEHTIPKVQLNHHTC